MSISSHFNVFSGNPLDRAGNQRRDEKWLADHLTGQETRFMLLRGLKPLVTKKPNISIAWQNALVVRPLIEDGATCIFLGLSDNIAHFAVDASNLKIPEFEFPFFGASRFEELRELAPFVSNDQAAILAQARSLIQWHLRNRFCAACGHATKSGEGGYIRFCADDACGMQHFPRTDPVVIMLVLNGERCLLGRQTRFPKNMYSALAGFMEPGETIEEAVAREVLEEAGVTVGNVRYHSSQPWPFPGSLMIGCYADAMTVEILLDSNEIEKANWFDRSSVRNALAGSDQKTGIQMPPSFAIAHQLARSWVEGDT